jgi:hypothetical protein
MWNPFSHKSWWETIDRKVLTWLALGVLVGAAAATGYFYRINPKFISSSTTAQKLSDEEAIKKQAQDDCEAFIGPRPVTISNLKLLNKLAAANVNCSNPSGGLDYIVFRKVTDGSWIVIYRGDKPPSDEISARLGLPKDLFSR